MYNVLHTISKHDVLVYRLRLRNVDKTLWFVVWRLPGVQFQTTTTILWRGQFIFKIRTTTPSSGVIDAISYTFSLSFPFNLRYSIRGLGRIYGSARSSGQIPGYPAWNKDGYPTIHAGESGCISGIRQETPNPAQPYSIPCVIGHAWHMELSIHISIWGSGKKWLSLLDTINRTLLI